MPNNQAETKYEDAEAAPWVVEEVTGSLTWKLLQIMAAVDHVDKQGTAPVEAGGYSYMYAKDIAHAFRPQFIKYGVMVMGSIVEIFPWTGQTKGGKPLNGVHVLMDFTFRDVKDDRQQVVVRAAGSGLDSGDKAIYKAQTGALKYALRSAFLVPDAAADAEADAPEADAVEYVKAPQRVTPAENYSEPYEETTSFQQGRQEQSGPQRTQQAPFRRAGQGQGGGGGKNYGPPKNPGERISDAQRKRLFAISKNAGLSDDDVHSIIQPFGFTSTNEITKGTYEKICAIAESGGIRE